MVEVILTAAEIDFVNLLKGTQFSSHFLCNSSCIEKINEQDKNHWKFGVKRSKTPTIQYNENFAENLNYLPRSVEESFLKLKIYSSVFVCLQ